MAQIGEFSFILAGLGTSLNLLPAEGRDLILAGAILSILINPLLFVALDRFVPRLQTRKRGDASAEAASAPSPEWPVTSLSGHTVLVGYGRVGSLIGQALKERGEAFLVIEERDGTAERLRADGVEVLLGNAGERGLLAAANLGSAKRLVSAIPNVFEASNLLETARAANPGIEIVARAHSDAEVEHLKKFGADHIVLGEREIAREMARFLFGERGTFLALDERRTRARRRRVRTGSGAAEPLRAGRRRARGRARWDGLCRGRRPRAPGTMEPSAGRYGVRADRALPHGRARASFSIPPFNHGLAKFHKPSLGSSKQPLHRGRRVMR